MANRRLIGARSVPVANPAQQLNLHMLSSARQPQSLARRAYQIDFVNLCAPFLIDPKC